MQNALIILAIVIVVSLLYANANASKVEGFKAGNAPDDRNKKIESQVKELKDDLNAAEYHADYDDMMVNLEKWAQMERLKVLVSADMTNPKEMMNSVKSVNDLSLFLDNLEHASKFLMEKT